MQVVHMRCCGLDVHKKTVVACVLLTQPDVHPDVCPGIKGKNSS